ncbi:TraB/GumN family protein [Tateyamaria omphalii]|uniref:TraB/GumN family protein n=1 Tax=Tateyamaria omphalii TaxID=299262 RepID=UPI001C996205|nr:TraB/GumN family protein [Tateyamaria omphalii]MBY5931668.1 TraB/GumN family protein [Tateyamaria omphalii]
MTMQTLLKHMIFAAALLVPAAVQAACSGTDVRPSLSEEARAEIAERTAALPYPEGNHWRATRGEQTITLVGTMHLHDPRMSEIVARLAPTVASADLLLVEITAEEEAALLNAISTDPTIAFLTDGPSLIDRVSPEVWDALATAAQKRGVPPFMAAKYQPWFLSLTLAIAPCAMADLHAGKVGLDKLIMAEATQASVPIAALETHREMIDLLAADPIEEQIQFLPLIAQMEHTVDDATATTVAAYFEEQHGALLAFSRVFTRDRIGLPSEEFEVLFDEMMAMLLDQRNMMWMDRIDQREEPNIVIAVGAAHLGGETGLLNQLELRGFTLERQPF